MVAITTSSPLPHRHFPVPHGPRQRPRSLRVVPDRVIADGVIADRVIADGQTPRASRLVTAALVAIVLVAVGLLVASPSAPAASAATLDAHVVAEGETMWSIAQDIAPTGEAATYVERLVDANGGASVQVGQALTVPVP